MFEEDQGADWQQLQDALDEERRYLDCLVVVHRAGHEGTADCLAVGLKLSDKWKRTKEQYAPRLASVG